MLHSFIRAAVVRTALRLGTTTRRQAVLRLGNGLRCSNKGEILSYNRQNISIGLNSVHQFQCAYSSITRHSEWEIPRYVQSETALSVHINGKTLPLPLPDDELFKVNVTWNGYNDQRAPFLNRSSILYDMLEGAFHNWYQSSSRNKEPPVYTIQAMHDGSGKTRLQIEWIYHLLNNPKIITRFLGADPIAQVEKKRFINVLYDTAFRQRIILVSGQTLVDMPSTEPDDKMIRRTIMTRFQDEEISFNGKTVTIDDSLKEQLPENPVKYAALFSALVNKLTDTPKILPFEGKKFSIDQAQQLLVFGLDECQKLHMHCADSENSVKDSVYKLLSRCAESDWLKVSPFWVVTGTTIPGTFVPGHFRPITSSLDSLLHVSCLNTIAKQYFGKQLPGFNTNECNLKRLLHPNTAKALTCLFFKTLGLPRAIEKMIGKTKLTFDSMEKAYWKKYLRSNWGIDPLQRQSDATKQLGNSIENLHRELQDCYPEAKMAGKLQKLLKKSDSHVTQAIQLLDLKAVFCLRQNVNEPIPHLGVTPKELEECVYLMQWQKISETEKCYTRPFLIDYDDTDDPLPLLKYQAETSKYWTPFSISLYTLILPDSIASYLDDGLTTHASFEHVTAASLYARYVLVKQSKGEDSNIQLEDIFGISEPHYGLPDSLQKGIAVNWNGVAVLDHSADSTSQEVLDEIWHKKVIAIDSMSSSPYIIVPVTIEQKPAWIGIQKKRSRTALCRDKFYDVAELRPSPGFNMPEGFATLPARAIVSPIFESYFEFAPIFNDFNLAVQEPEDN